MKRISFSRSFTSVLAACAVILSMAAVRPAAVHAENFQFITDIQLASGTDGISRLESDGYSVRAIGLNASVDDDHQVWIGYKINDGSPVTDIIVSADAGESLQTKDGVKYERAGNVDVDKGNGGGGGCVYITHDENAGSPLVGLDVLRSDSESKKNLLPITNDGSEVVRRDDGIPADLEVNADTVIYMAQIRDGLVRPYISEIAVVQAEDKEEAVYKAACAGYNYYVTGDVDNSKGTYTILAYDRTADADQAVRNIVALTTDLTKYLEDGQIIAGDGKDSEKGQEPQEESGQADNAEGVPEENTEAKSQENAPDGAAPEEAVPGEAASDEGAPEETSEEIPAQESQDGAQAPEGEEAQDEENPPAEEVPEAAPQPDVSDDDADPDKAVPSDVTVKMTADAIDLSGIEYDRISSTAIDGKNPYYLYVSTDKKAGNPITMLYDGSNTDVTGTTLGSWAYGYFSSKGMSSANSYILNEDRLEKLKDKKDVYVKLPITLLAGEKDENEQIALKGKTLKLAFLTAEKGLPEDDYTLNGLREATYEPPKMERDGKTYEGDSTEASAFGKTGPVVIIAGILAIAAALFAGWRIVRKKKRPLA